MYAAYEVDRSPHPTTRTAVSIKSDDFSVDTIRNSDLCGRILTYCFVGTFGLLSPTYLHASAATANWKINQIEIVGENASAAHSESSAARDVARIRETMKISVTELARVFGVSRQAVHEWIRGGALSPRNTKRLSELARAADVFRESGIDVTPHILRRKVGNGPSILESTAENGIVVELAQTLVETLSRETKQRQRLAARLAGRPQPDPIPSEFGAPYLNEKA